MTSTLELLILAMLAEPPWIPLSLQAGWSNTGGGFVAAQYRLWPLSNELEIVGNVSHTAIVGGGTSIFAASLVAPYLPASTQKRGAQCVIAPNVYASNTEGPFVVLPTSGAIQFQFLPVNVTQVEFHGFIPMDA